MEKEGKIKNGIFLVVLFFALLFTLIMIASFSLTGNPILKNIEKFFGGKQDKVSEDKLSFNVYADVEIVEDSEFAKINIQDDRFDPMSMNEGAPELKHKILFYYIPFGKQVKELRIEDKNEKIVRLGKPLAVNPKPVPCCDPDDVVFPPVFDNSVYRKGFYPENPVEIIGKNWKGGSQIIQVVYRPVSYDGNKLKVIDSVDFSFVLEDSDKEEFNPDRLDYVSVENYGD